MDLTFDVVIPTTRLVPEHLVRLLRVHESAPEATVVYYVVVDLPGADIHAISALVQNRRDVVVLQNATWLGAHDTRNRAMEQGNSAFVLFLDDDVVPSPRLLAEYVAAISGTPESPGYVGVTRFPTARDNFTKGIVASDILTFFDLAARRPHMPWGVTANLCLRRSAIGSARFSNAFPKAGGGEDIDLCLRITQGRALVSVPEAWVDHPWWADGRGSYRRFFRWAFGDSRLASLHPQHRYWNAPTLPERLLLLAVLWLLRPSTSLPVVVAVALGVVGVELAVDYGKLLLRGCQISPRVAFESTIIRVSNDLGRLFGNLLRGRPWGLFERFDYFCDRVHVGGERGVAMAKLGGTLVIIALIGRLAP